MEVPKRKPNRLNGYDYSRSGAYFLTICTLDRLPTLSEIPVGDGFPVPSLTYAGRIAKQYIELIPEKFPAAAVDHYVIMPNHLHLILFLSPSGDGEGGQGRGTGDPSPTTVGVIVGWLKYQITKQVNLLRGTPGARVLQRSFHDHIIRDEGEYLKIREYIDTNPQSWEKDCFYVRV